MSVTCHCLTDAPKRSNLRLPFIISGQTFVWFHLHYACYMSNPNRRPISLFSHRNNILTSLLTPCSTVLLEKLSGFHPVKKFLAFFGTRKFVTAFTIAHHLSLSRASSIQSICPHPTSWRSILILSSHLRLGFLSVSFPQVSPPKPCIRLSSLRTRYMPRPCHPSRFYYPNSTGWAVQIIELLIM